MKKCKNSICKIRSHGKGWCGRGKKIVKNSYAGAVNAPMVEVTPPTLHKLQDMMVVKQQVWRENVSPEWVLVQVVEEDHYGSFERSSWVCHPRTWYANDVCRKQEFRDTETTNILVRKTSALNFYIVLMHSDNWFNIISKKTLTLRSLASSWHPDPSQWSILSKLRCPTSS